MEAIYRKLMKINQELHILKIKSKNCQVIKGIHYGQMIDGIRHQADAIQDNLLESVYEGGLK